jgi:hypothetical protein
MITSTDRCFEILKGGIRVLTVTLYGDRFCFNGPPKKIGPPELTALANWLLDRAKERDSNDADKNTKRFSERELRNAVGNAYETCAKEIANGKFNLIGAHQHFSTLAQDSRTGEMPKILADWQERTKERE